MSVATHLGLGDPDTDDLLGLARSRWSTWSTEDPRLAVVSDLVDLPPWLTEADHNDADRVLLSLARLSSPAGDDDVVAAGALVWLLLPGASLIAHRLRTLSHRIDEIVAAQLWVETRSFPWQRGHKVAANILANTRKGVLRDLGVGEHLRRMDQAWSQAVPLPPEAHLWARIETGDSEQRSRTAAREVVDVLGWAVHAGVVTDADCALLLRLAEEADRTGTRGARRGRLGLMAPAASQAVAHQVGVSARTVRRRAARTLHVLGQACSQAQIPA